MEGELIAVAIISQIGIMIGIVMWNGNWFKRENFKIKKANILAENRLKLKKLERELGLANFKTDNPPVDKTSNKLDLLTQLAPLISKLDSDQIGTLFDKFMGGGDLLEDEGAEGILNQIPQPLIDAFLDGLKKENVPGGERGEKKGFTGQG